ncbi:hypothetical protein ILFOPFJJ_01070 [Ensifer psoraleae]|uniref:hypothetical protein n=1 Tax=Sinorhizobium psoraleae TaxID=520838 RepID=UPI0015682F8B|nr:hypothetical protein [Sinorhizobium psoraleae]NRP70192.1 hypothetical protein [Sinorhizobium psoraleae]
MHRVFALDVMPDGRVVPVAPEDLPDFTKPPEGLSRQVRRQWERRYRDFRIQYDMPADLAWYSASKLTLGAEWNFRE